VDITHFTLLASNCLQDLQLQLHSALPVLQQDEWMALVIQWLMMPVMCMSHITSVINHLITKVIHPSCCMHRAKTFDSSTCPNFLDP
jgi:hypothetical protein